VIITVIAVRVMQVAIHQVTDVVAMWRRLMPASRAVNVSRFVPTTVVRRRAICRVDRAHWDHVLFHDSIIAHSMQVAVMQVIDMILVLDANVSASWSMNVIVIIVRVGRHTDLHSVLDRINGYIHV
jgi:hypothetical protein